MNLYYLIVFIIVGCYIGWSVAYIQNLRYDVKIYKELMNGYKEGIEKRDDALRKWRDELTEKYKQ